ncbi:MAG: hypothetical protein M1829_005738 [Trizodia sp. TS-e1964]|nr:MAG: hypothetical protein M1829_005738 [Trizodia sp. TS-e1964]
MQFTNAVSDLAATIAILATSASAFGVHITDCNGNNDKFYHGGGTCYPYDFNAGFELKSIQSTCTVTGYAGGSCSSSATAIRQGVCFIHVSSFSVDNCN